MKEKFAKLIDVKTIVTFTVIAATTALTLTGKLEADKYFTIATVIIAFYFGTQKMKKEGE